METRTATRSATICLFFNIMFRSIWLLDVLKSLSFTRLSLLFIQRFIRSLNSWHRVGARHGGGWGLAWGGAPQCLLLLWGMRQPRATGLIYISTFSAYISIPWMKTLDKYYSFKIIFLKRCLIFISITWDVVFGWNNLKPRTAMVEQLFQCGTFVQNQLPTGNSCHFFLEKNLFLLPSGFWMIGGWWPVCPSGKYRSRSRVSTFSCVSAAQQPPTNQPPLS